MKQFPSASDRLEGGRPSHTATNLSETFNDKTDGMCKDFIANGAHNPTTYRNVGLTSACRKTRDVLTQSILPI